MREWIENLFVFEGWRITAGLLILIYVVMSYMTVMLTINTTNIYEGIIILQMLPSI